MVTSQKGEKWVLMTELNGEPLLHHFKISNFGRVIKIKKGRGEGHIFEPKQIGGYNYISFSTKMKSRETIYLHRLIAELFIEKPSDEHEYVLHKDYNRQNNVWTNLEWVDKETLYRHRALRAGRKRGKTKSIALPKHTTPPQPVTQTSEQRRIYSQLFGIAN